METNRTAIQDGNVNVGTITSIRMLLARLMWTCMGPVALVLTALMVAGANDGWLAKTDIAFAAIVCLMLLGRFVEHFSGTATTAYGEPASGKHLKRYVLVFSLVAVAAWVAANVTGNYLIGASSAPTG